MSQECQDRTKHFISDYLQNNKPLLREKMEAYQEACASSNKPIFRFLDISITSTCNLSCAHCYAFGYRQYNDLPLELWDKAINEAKEAGAFMFFIQGGEPTAAMDRLEHVLNTINTTENFVTVLTNGFRMKRKTLETLRNWGVDKIAVSLESGDPDEHDANRGRKGCFEDATNTLFMARELGFAVSISSGVTHQKVQSGGLDKLVDFCRKNQIRADVQPAAPVGNFLGNWDVVCTDDDIVQIKKHSEADGDLVSDVYLISRDIYPRHSRQGCPALKSFLTINSSGEIFPCPFIQISLGNVRNTTIQEALEKGQRVDYFKQYWPVCLASEDRDFMRNHLIPAAEPVMRGAKYRTFEEQFS